MQMFSGLRVFIFLTVVLLSVEGATDAQISSLEVYSTVDNSERVYVGDEVTVTFLASPAGEAPLYITAENIEVISIQGASDHLGPILSSNYTTSPGGELVVTGVFTGAGNAFIHAHWDRPHPSNDLASRAVFEVRVPLPPATLEIVSGNHQHGYSGTSLQPLVVVVNDRNGKPLSGINVAFRVTMGLGRLASARTRTDRLGRAETTLTLGPEMGVYQVEASVDGYPLLMQTFTAAATAECEIPEPEPSRATTLSIVSGYGQEGLPGSRLSHPFVVEVRDQYGNAVLGVDVAFRVNQGSGSLSPITVQSNDLGRASTILTLGRSAGVNVVEASVTGIVRPQIFTATVIAPPAELPVPTKLEIISGNNQLGEVGKPLARPFVVGVLDQNDKALTGIDITFTVTEGNGQFSPNSAATEGVITNEYGQASVILRLGPEAGVNRVRASVGGTQLWRTFAAAATTPALPIVYWIESGAIFRFDGRIRDKLDIPFSMGWTATSLAVDMVRSKLYWTEWQGDQQSGRIRSANLNGRNSKVLGIINAVPEGIVVDAKNGWLYWTNSRGRIQSINVNGRGFNGNLIANLGAPEHIELGLGGDADTASGTLYWTVYDETEKSGSIWYKRLGSSMREEELLTGLGKLNGIAVDGNKLYWTEEIDGAQGKISSAYHNGTGNKTLSYVPGSVPLGLAVDKVGRRLYWTDSGGNIQSLSLNFDKSIEIVVEGLNIPAVAIALGRLPVGSIPASPAAPSTIVESSDQNVLLANYPNPFNPETWIPYQLSEARDVTVSIYSVNGQLVRRLDLGHQAAGVYRSRSRAAYWDGCNAFGERVASGLYFYTLRAGGFAATRKMLIRK